MGTIRYSKIAPAFPPPKRTPRIRMASPNGAPFFCNRREETKHHGHGNSDLLRQVEPFHCRDKFTDRCCCHNKISHDYTGRKPQQDTNDGYCDIVCYTCQAGTDQTFPGTSCPQKSGYREQRLSISWPLTKAAEGWPPVR